MPFGAILGLVGSAIGAFGSSSSSSRASRDARYQAQLADQANQRQYQLGLEQLSLGRQQLGVEQDIANRTFAENAANRSLAIDQRDYERRFADRILGMGAEERNADIARINSMDQLSQAERLRRIQEVERIYGVRQNERDYALGELDEAQHIARGERAFDEEQLRRSQRMAEAERLWQMGQYDAARALASEERDYDINQRELVRGRTDRLARELELAYRELGTPVEAEILGRDDIEKERMRREGQYVSDVDRAVDRVASINEADLIRSGMDRSTPGTARRGEVAERAGQAYSDARMRASDEALRYITGTQQQLLLPEQLHHERAQQILGQIRGVYGAPIEYDLQMPAVRSALEGMQFDRVGSGVYDRQIRSGNDYTTPMDIGSAVPIEGINDFGTGSSGMMPRSAIAGGPAGASGVFQGQMPGYTSPASFFSGGNNLVAGVAGNYTDSARIAAQRASQAAAGAGAAWGDFLTRGGSMLDDWWSNRRSPASQYPGPPL